ncbi:alpha-galactosidase [Halalkalibacter hemicellulosilyticusJCM 9152]|uniref:Alpha-galactosidase n=1 Tax=Halalkalibacter hemicellulosilyticusJCM 9152 TaxID=1236971 RepID=W4QKU3_9BACI|nr:alpha-galactosidase [Halalkalibacter hemicellulosilyticusJCM 9152]
MPHVGELPLGCASVCQTSISVQRLSVEAAILGNDQLLRQAFMMDPLVGAVCNPPEIWQLVDEMLVAQEQWLPQYVEAIELAKERLSSEELIPTRNYKGAARLKTKSIKEMQENRDEAMKNATEADKAKERPSL